VFGSPANMIDVINQRLRAVAQTEDANILSLDERVQQDGLLSWFAPSLWHRAKQEVTPAAAPFYGELVLRIIDAQRGNSSKCLVLDLDNTLWGGVIGDDGLTNIELGQGSAGGEAFVAFQTWVKALSQRGVILAVCSKNDERNALEPFEKHPDMVLRRDDIAAFVANWDDKAANIRRIALNLNIGIDSLVFVDDNPFERNIVRRELPMVKVPELPEDPSFWATRIADAGYFEALDITKEDIDRRQLYQAAKVLSDGVVPTTDVEGYLKSLNMRLIWSRFTPVAMKRVTQLINKTNQFNLTTCRYTDAETAAMLEDPSVLGLHLRLIDRYADHGIISVIIGRDGGDGELDIDTWLMSCRVLGRGIEQASLAVLAAEARRSGFRTLVGHYRPTRKNDMVRDHYLGLGFKSRATNDGLTSWHLQLEDQVFAPESVGLEAVNGG
jgi:FkbH-like protein